MRFCPNCGLPVTAAPRFCAVCGTPLGPASGRATHAATSPVGRPATSGPGQWPPASWGRSDPRAHRTRQDTADLNMRQYWPAPPADQDTAGPWAEEEQAGPWPQEQAGPWPQEQAGPWPQEQAGPWAEEQLDGDLTVPDAFVRVFAEDRLADCRNAPSLPSGARIPATISRAMARPRIVPRARVAMVCRLFVVLATLALLAAGGLVTWQAVNHHGGLDSATARLHSSSPVASSPVASSRGTSPPPAGDDAVAIAPAVAQDPLARQVAALLRNYFRSINRHDFEEYDGLFVPQLRGSVQNFNAGYRLTTDSRRHADCPVRHGPAGPGGDGVLHQPPEPRRIAPTRRRATHGRSSCR